MVGFYLAFSLLPLLGFNEREVLKLMSFQELKPTPLKISVTEADLPIVSSNVQQAENWLKSHFLIQSPSTKITQIEVGNGVLCNKSLEPMWSSVLPSVKNLHSVLAKWSMVREVELSVSLSSNCLDKNLKPLLSFLKDYYLSCSIEERSPESRVIEMKGEAKPMSRELASLSFLPSSILQSSDQLAEEKIAKGRKLQT